METGVLAQPGHIEIGRYLSQVRERAGMKQAELARKITWSPAVLSRIESGERQVGPDELDIILKAIGTPEASRLSAKLSREWEIIPRPLLDHSDEDLLWAAEQVAKELLALKNGPDIRSAFERRISEYLGEIQQSANHLLKRDHQVAFIGSIGIGKSTAICRLLGLEVPGQEGGPAVPVLEAGAGGITICEVHLRTGPGYGLMVEPRSDEEVRADVSDFVDHILGDRNAVDDEGDNESADSQGISKEIERAIRNMAQLKIRRERGPDGKLTRSDEAKDLAQRIGSARELVVDVLARMQLHKRDMRDIWYHSSSGKAPLDWLKDSFEQINNGRHPEFTLPKRIEVIVPQKLLEGTDLSIRFIDTRGIDRTAARADLEGLLDEPHTLAVLCSGFNNAPSAEARLLLERARDAGVRGIQLRAGLLVLPRVNEALAVKDESGIRVDSVGEGYELKGEQISLALEPLRLGQIAVGFYDAFNDEPERLRRFLIESVGRVREAFRARMQVLTTNAKALLLNHEREQVQEVQRAAGAFLKTWINRNKSVSSLKGHVQDSLMTQITQVYASTLRASVRREGEWINLSYSHHLGYGARRIAAVSLSKTVDGFSELCKTFLEDRNYSDAKELVQQADQLLSSAFEELLRKVQLMGQTAFRDALKVDPAFWAGCEREWGQGPGYRNRVAARNDAWFSDMSRQQLEKELQALIEREWVEKMDRLSAIFETE